MTELFRQFIRFAGVGCMSAIGQFGLLIILVQVAHSPAVFASTAGMILGAVINYSLNYHFTFRSSSRHRDSAIRFGILFIIGLTLNAFFMWIGVDVLHANYLLTQIVAVGLIMVWNFFWHRFWTFSMPADSN